MKVHAVASVHVEENAGSKRLLYEVILLKEPLKCIACTNSSIELYLIIG